MKCLLIRADTSPEIGAGHVMRCLALAQAWQDEGGSARFVLAAGASVLEERLVSERMVVSRISAEPGSEEDAARTTALASEMGAQWVVVDGYQFDSAYQKAIKDAGYSLLVWDDYGHADHYYADLVLNQNISADAAMYTSREPYTRLLLGTRYVVLRREFRSLQSSRQGVQPDVARKILVTLGGGDPDNVTLRVVNALTVCSVAGLEAKVVVGGSNPHYNEILAAAGEAESKVEVLHSVDNMARLMTWADVAISAGGSTCWELAFMQLPALVIALAENQCPVVQSMGQAGVAISLGWHAKISMGQICKEVGAIIHDAALRDKMVRCATDLVDGKGSKRVLHIMQEIEVATNCQQSPF